MRLSSVAEIASASPMLGIAREILGEQAKPFRATLFDKSTEANWLVVWHQDTALPLTKKTEKPGWGPWSVKDGVIYVHVPTETLQRVIALRLHLDDSFAENGPLRVLPGTHRFGVMEDERIHAFASEVKSVDCLVEHGGVLAMRPLIVHGSSKSQKEMPRRVLHIEYADSTTVADGLELAIA